MSPLAVQLRHRVLPIEVNRTFQKHDLDACLVAQELQLIRSPVEGDPGVRR